MKVFLKQGRERPVMRGSAWVFSGALERAADIGGAGSVTDVFSSDGQWLARGVWCGDQAELAVRILERRQDAPVDEDWLSQRLIAAAARRFAIAGRPEEWTDTTGWRMAFSEADGVSGLVIDRFGPLAVVQVGSAGWSGWEEAIRRAVLASQPGVERVALVATDDAVLREGLALRPGRGDVPDGGGTEERVWFRESGAEFSVLPGGGQKTGFYLDQRDNRARVAAVAKGRRMLSAYCYTGAFEILAARAGAEEVTGWDSSEAAVAAAKGHAERNGVAGVVSYEVADVPSRLRKARDKGERWDLIVLDPPRLVHSKGGLERGMRAYKDINLLALKLLAPGGLLATFSCSGLVDGAMFRRMLGWAAADSGRTAQVIGDFGQPFDHPRLVGGEECDYLKGFLIRVD